MANDEIAEKLGEVDLFREVSPKIRKKIADAGRVVDFGAGHAVTTDGKSGVAFHLVLEGTAEVEVAGKSRPTLTPGQGFGEISLLDGLPRSATVRAGSGGLKTFGLSAWEFIPILDENPSVARALLKVLCARIRSIESTPAE